jgi:hypothetical protein
MRTSKNQTNQTKNKKQKTKKWAKTCFLFDPYYKKN